jgi:hypothetical protein
MNRFRQCHREISEDAVHCPVYRRKGRPVPEKPYGGFPDVHFKALTFEEWSRCQCATGSAASDWADTGAHAARYRLQVAELRLLWCVGRAFNGLWFSGANSR